MTSANNPLKQQVQSLHPDVDVIYGHADGYIGYLVTIRGKVLNGFVGFFTEDGAWQALVKHFGLPAPKRKGETLDIHIEGLTIPQKLAITDLLFRWQNLGQIGSSRWTCFYADGDGNFRPRIIVDGLPPTPVGTREEQVRRWQDGEYRIDFDDIADSLRAKEMAC